MHLQFDRDKACNSPFLPVNAEISMEKMERVGKGLKMNAFKGRLVQKITGQIRRVSAIIIH